MTGLPTYESFFLPTLQVLHDGSAALGDLARRTADRMGLPPEAAAARLPWNGQPVLEARVEQAALDLTMAELVRRDGARLSLTERGRNVVAETPAAIDLDFLGRFPEFAAYRAEKRLRRGA